MIQSLLTQVKNDCISNGYGRKKWWADQLQVPPLTLSHWFAGRQSPNGESALAIKDILDSHQQAKKAEKFKDYLWDAYRNKENLSPFLVSNIILGILSKETIDSRTLALLSVFIEKVAPPFDELVSGRLVNRLGWLLAVSGQKYLLTPDRSLPAQDLLQNSDRSTSLKKYLRKFQTPLGKKWKIYDCPLEEMKGSLPWFRS